MEKIPGTSRTSNSSETDIQVGVGTYRPLTNEFLKFSKQLGVNDVLLTPHPHNEFESVIPLGETWTTERLQNLYDRISGSDLRLHAIEKMPVPLYEVLLDDYDKKIKIIKNTIANMGKVGIPILGYSGHPPWGAVRTNKEHNVRGSAKVSAYSEDDLETRDIDKIYRNVSRDHLWGKYEEFLSDVIPVAEKAGVILAVHPSDPPVPEINGLPMLFHSRKNFERALKVVPSENHGLKLCLGCWSEMGENIPEVIRQFGSNNIIYIHFRDVVGTVPDFHETFIDDDKSNFDEMEVMESLYNIGFEGVITPDHVPIMEHDTEWGFVSPQGQSFSIGYLRGLTTCLNHHKQH